ncbi:MAG: sulfite exporter TauE/SafE family protein [Nitrospirae bacterium]|nr:sulfite exporter TauE/SafE family protein [Nitrospirota bacterium]
MIDMNADYLLIFTTGLFGGFGHCIGMCGPIVASYSISGKTDIERPFFMNLLLPHLLYNAGRIMTYTLIGGAMGFAGSLLNIAGQLSGIRNAIAVTAGLFMIIMGVGILGFPANTAWFEKHNISILKQGQRLLKVDSFLKYFPLGLLFGLLPCGFSMAAFAASAGTGSTASGMLLSFLFGLGTMPSLVIFGIAASFISSKLRGLFYKAAGVTVILMGILFLLKGFRHHAHM